ncbi:MAG: FlgD immunoglobulin-like domain containing protein [bacterium]
MGAYRQRLIHILLIFVTVASGHSQLLNKHSYRLDGDISTRLAGNGIIDILAEESTIWVATGNGLNKTTDNGQTWWTYDHRHNLGRGGVSAIAIRSGVIWVTTAYDTTIQDEDLPVGGGLSYSTDGGDSWTYIPQPGVTPIQGLTYDIALTDSSIWLACFGQSLQFSADNGSTWTTRVPDRYPWDPFTYLNQRVFSVIATDDAIWVGTAGGINRTTDGGQTWINMNHLNSGISGNFVVALAEQKHEGKSIIWAATWKAEGRTEYYGVSRTENGGLTWTVCLEGEFVHNFGIDGPTVYAATDNGLKKSTDGGVTWGTFPQMVDRSTGEKIDWQVFYSVRAQTGVLWAGSGDGLAKTEDNGLTWTVYRAFAPTEKEETYAYPNPWSPLRWESNDLPPLRLQYHTTRSTRVTIKIYDFALDLVRTLVDGKHRGPGDFSEIWDGRNREGEVVANGVYYYVVEKEGDGAARGKIVILD